jgi:hypothetical protein
MRERQKSIAGRDQGASVFASILLRLCDGTGAPGAALVDREGETVDYAGTVNPYEIRVAAAEWRLIFGVLAGSRFPFWPDTSAIFVRAGRRSFAAFAMPDGYALVVQLQRLSFAISERAVSECVREICHEAGFEVPEGGWTRVDVKVRPGDRRGPAAIWRAGAWCALEVLGRYARAELGHGEIGYRARLATGAEITLVREPLGRWYAEDLPGES